MNCFDQTEEERASGDRGRPNYRGWQRWDVSMVGSCTFALCCLDASPRSTVCRLYLSLLRQVNKVLKQRIRDTKSIFKCDAVAGGCRLNVRSAQSSLPNHHAYNVFLFVLFQCYFSVLVL